MAANGFAISRQLGRLSRASGARGTSLSLSLRLAANAQRPWICRSCSRGTSGGSTAFVRKQSTASYAMLDTFPRRHIGPNDLETTEMLQALDPPVKSLDEFVAQVIPADILSSRQLFPNARSEANQPTEAAVTEALPESEVLSIADALQRDEIQQGKSYIGAGYYGTLVPEVIKRNVLENPAWYTSYTPYQAEISQGRLESLLNFQTMVTDLTGLAMSNASLLDEGTAAAEALTLSMNALSSSRAKRPGKTYVVSDAIHPQTLAVMRSRAEGFGIAIETADVLSETFAGRLEELSEDIVGILVQYPDTYGRIKDFRQLADSVHSKGALLSVATDLLALTVLTPPGEWGADIAFGSAQRLGVPMGFGGPHAAFFAVMDKHKRKMPGRLIGVSKDRLGGKALRLALQTREQHIRREKATSNVCTAQALLANMAALYACYHGPEGLREIAEKVMKGAAVVREAATAHGWKVVTDGALFDTVVIRSPKGEQAAADLLQRAKERGIHLRHLDDGMVGISVDEATTKNDLVALVACLINESDAAAQVSVDELLKSHDKVKIPEAFKRKSDYLTHPNFNTHHSETEMLRYIHHLSSKDLSLVHSMIPLGSCTMKLNGSTEMALITKPGFSNVHPFAPRDTVKGYLKMISSLEDQLKSITAMDNVSLQPNSGAQGEFAGLRAIRKYHEANGSKNRDICLIPVSAHGTNPASAAMAGMRVVTIKCDTKTGNLDLADLEAKCEKHRDQLGAFMVTYPSTFGVFEPGVKQACELVHAHGGQVYMDGANMNAQIGLCSPGEIGADVCHLNLHKTFCIPHGGGGPGVGPIAVKAHLAPHLAPTEIGITTGLISSAPYGSASILPISWAYNMLMGAAGLKKATQLTLLNANYLLGRLRPHYPILYTNAHGRCAHEFILDARPFSASAGVEAIDIAKRLQDYGFHAPTMSWPVANTLMVEPTESESREELDRFVDALVSIREEIREVEEGRAPRVGNVLKMAPHPMHDVVTETWDRPYSREKAVYPRAWLRERKFWPTVGRVDDSEF